MYIVHIRVNIANMSVAVELKIQNMQQQTCKTIA